MYKHPYLCIFVLGTQTFRFHMWFLIKVVAMSPSQFDFNDMTPGELSTVHLPLVLINSVATGTIALNNCTGSGQGEYH